MEFVLRRGRHDDWTTALLCTKRLTHHFEVTHVLEVLQLTRDELATVEVEHCQVAIFDAFEVARDLCHA